ncbi:unnamed protein product [Orchesella dallaii]|uniref:Ankyrin repeat protein n=1 Tax=Orchesella dallaii TaxID=48710 RepID=A0ABP1RAQ7_9HEXA
MIGHNAYVNDLVALCLEPFHNLFHSPSQSIVDIVKLLIDNGADPDFVDERGLTFLHRAAEFLTPELYDKLIMYFDSSGRKDAFKMLTPTNQSHLHISVENFQPLQTTLDIFKSNVIDFNGLDSDGESVVFVAIRSGRNAEFISTLFNYGSDWMISDKKENNPLHVAALYENISALKLFISLGCDVNAKNIMRRTPLHNSLLSEIQHDTFLLNEGEHIQSEYDIVELLTKESVDITAKDINDTVGFLPLVPKLLDSFRTNGFLGFYSLFDSFSTGLWWHDEIVEK